MIYRLDDLMIEIRECCDNFINYDNKNFIPYNYKGIYISI